MNRTFMVSVLIQYILELVAFGFRRHRQKEFVFETVAYVAMFRFFFSKNRLRIENSADSITRALKGIVVFFQIFRYLKRNSPLT